MNVSEEAWLSAEKRVASWFPSVASKLVARERFLVGYDIYLDKCVNYILISGLEGWERQITITESVTTDVDVDMYYFMDSHVFNWNWHGVTD